jgi:mRNA interferase MazF
VIVERGQMWTADLGEPEGAEPAYNPPILIVQSDAFDRSRLHTVIAVVLSTNLRLVDAPGNVLIPARSSGLRKTPSRMCRRCSLEWLTGELKSLFDVRASD